MDDRTEALTETYERTENIVEGLVSVIIPCLNMELYISKCLDSVLAQTYSDIEVIVVDNASIDATVRIIKEYEKKDKRVRLVERKKTRSVGSSRNIGLDMARGEYIWHVDSDDYAEINFLEIMLKRMKDEDVDIVQCCYTSFDDLGKEKDYLPYDTDRIYSGRELCEYMNDFVGLCGPNTMVWNKLYKRKIWQEMRFYEGRGYEDMFQTYKVLYPQDRILWIKDRLMHWRKNVSSGTSAFNYRIFYLDEVYAYIERLSYFNDKQDEKLYKLVMKRLYYISTQHLYLYTTFIDDETKVKKQDIWLRGIIKQLYPELKKMDWPLRTRLRMRFIRYFPKTFGKMSVKYKLDFRK